MRSLDKGGEVEPHRESTPNGTRVHVSNSPAFIRANRDALAAIRKTVIRLKTDIKLAGKNGPKR